MLAQASPISKPLWGEPPAAASGPTAVAGGGGGGMAVTKGPGIALSPMPPLIIPPIPPIPHDLSRTIEQKLKDLSSPPPGLHHQQAVNPMDNPLTQVLETPGTSSPPPPATTALDGKEEDAAATAAGAASKPADVIRSARSLFFGRLQGRGWPGGSVSGRVWLGVGRDDD